MDHVAYLNAIPYVPARDQWPRRTNAPHIWIVLHSIEAGEFEQTAENCANYFRNPGPRVASTQFVVDANSTIRCAEWNNRVAGAVGANDEGWHIEQAGFAAQSKNEWRDGYSQQMVVTQTAPLVAALAARDGIPLTFVDAAGLRARRPGVTTHAECYQAFGGDVRTDPGAHYPMGEMLTEARRIFTGNTPDPRPPEEDEDVASLEWQPNAKQLWIVSGNTKLYVKNISKDGIPHDEFVKAAKARGVVDNTQRPDGAQYLSQLSDISDPKVA